jgi:hypothetical protein
MIYPVFLSWGKIMGGVLRCKNFYFAKQGFGSRQRCCCGLASRDIRNVMGTLPGSRGITCVIKENTNVQTCATTDQQQTADKLHNYEEARPGLIPPLFRFFYIFPLKPRIFACFTRFYAGNNFFHLH